MNKIIDFKPKGNSCKKKELTTTKLSDGRYLLTIKGYAEKIEIVFENEESLNNWANRFYRTI